MKKTPLRRKKATKRQKPMAKKSRKPKETARVYGGHRRVEWVNGLGCLICLRGPCENAHVKSGGVGRKADAKWIVPLCRDHHAEHHRGARTFEAKYGVSLLKAAAQIESLWQSLFHDKN
jgi:hypothetical protein